jgi:hypothetical protein
MKQAALGARQAAAIEAAWHWFHRTMDEDVPFAAVVARVHARAPDVDLARIRCEFVQRLRRAHGRSSTRVVFAVRVVVYHRRR